MLRVSIFFTIFLLGISHVFAKPIAPREVTELVSQFKISSVDCPEKIWTGFDWKSLVVVFAYPQNQDSWVWDVSRDELTIVRNDTLDSSVLGSTYDFFKYDGKKAMSLDMNDEALKNDNQFFKLGVHEFFHYAGQAGWIQLGSANRGTLYPISWEPRLYRRMMFDHLKLFFTGNKQEDLQKAKYWYDKWTREHALETQMTTDLYEGSADYVEGASLALSQLGCQATDEALKSQIIKNLNADEYFGYALKGESFSLDSEGYPVGGLASYILRFSDIQLSDWNSQLAQGKSPLEILFQTVGPGLPTSAPEKLMTRFQETGRKTNSKYSEYLDSSIAGWSDKNFVRVPFVSQFLQSNLRPLFFAHSTELDRGLFPLAFDHHFLSTDKKTDFKILKSVVVVSDNSRTCENAHRYTLVAEEKILQNGNEFSIDSDSVKGTFQGSAVVSKEGFKYLCPSLQ